MASDEDGGGLIPPNNFAMVHPGVYRSGYPSKKNFPFLQKLQLKNIMYLCPESYPEANLEFLARSSITLQWCPVQGNKGPPDEDIPHGMFEEAVKIVLNKQNHPILIHCNKGKHRTGCLVGCVRRIQQWSKTAIFEEYRLFAHPKERFIDLQFIELFQYNHDDFDQLLRDRPSEEAECTYVRSLSMSHQPTEPPPAILQETAPSTRHATPTKLDVVK